MARATDFTDPHKKGEIVIHGVSVEVSKTRQGVKAHLIIISDEEHKGYIQTITMTRNAATRLCSILNHLLKQEQ